MFKRLASAWLLRSVARDLADVASSLRAQNLLLLRLADRFAPLDPPTTHKEVATDTGVSHLDPDELLLAMRYTARTHEQTGHLPDDEEVLIYLADEKTRSLAERLATRDQELQRLEESRKW